MITGHCASRPGLSIFGTTITPSAKMDITLPIHANSAARKVGAGKSGRVLFSSERSVAALSTSDDETSLAGLAPAAARWTR